MATEKAHQSRGTYFSTSQLSSGECLSLVAVGVDCRVCYIFLYDVMLHIMLFFFPFLIYLVIYFWPCWVFVGFLQVGFP